MSQENVDVVRAVIQGVEAGMALGDLGAAFDLGVEAGVMAADAELVPARELAGTVSYSGRNGFFEFMRTWTEDFEDWSIEIEQAIDADNDVVVTSLRQSGTGKGSGVSVNLAHGAVFELKGGCVVRIRLYLDPGEAIEAAGLSE